MEASYDQLARLTAIKEVAKKNITVKPFAFLFEVFIIYTTLYICMYQKTQIYSFATETKKLGKGLAALGDLGSSGS